MIQRRAEEGQVFFFPKLIFSKPGKKEKRKFCFCCKFVRKPRTEHTGTFTGKANVVLICLLNGCGGIKYYWKLKGQFLLNQGLCELESYRRTLVYLRHS